MGDIEIIKINSKKKVQNHLIEFIEIDSLCFDSSNWSKDNFIMELPMKFNLSFMCSYENKVIGYIFGSSYTLENEQTCHINRIAILPNFRSLNIGSKLLTCFENNSRENGFKKISLEFDLVLNVQTFYEKNSFKTVENQEKILCYLNAKSKVSMLELYTRKERKVMIKEIL